MLNNPFSVAYWCIIYQAVNAYISHCLVLGNLFCFIDPGSFKSRLSLTDVNASGFIKFVDTCLQNNTSYATDFLMEILPECLSQFIAQMQRRKYNNNEETQIKTNFLPLSLLFFTVFFLSHFPFILETHRDIQGLSWSHLFLSISNQLWHKSSFDLEHK